MEIPMKRLILFTLLMLSFVAAFATLPTCYYTYDQITAMLQSYETLYPTKAKVHLLGYSQQEQIPIYAIKITNNVLEDMDQPALLFVGQVHAEEVLGVQITMSNIKELLQNSEQPPYNNWMSQLEIWFIPTLNPEGHNVVTSNIDTSYRKNKRDINNNGIFDYSPLVGYDIDGVDINRNFGFNWAHGDTLMQTGGLEYYDYYRGPAEMSESEVQAMKLLADQEKFVYSIVWHSSRTGNLSEKIYYSFNWREVRPSPDVTLAQSIAAGVAGQIPNESGSGIYEALPNLGRKGNFHDWMYKQYGTIQLLVECGTSNLQPDSLLMVNMVQRGTNGVKWLLNRALPYTTAVPSSSLLTGLITEVPSQTPISAEVIVMEKHARWFEPRTSNSQYGRYYRPISPGTYTVKARKKGYFDRIYPNVSVNNGSLTMRNIELTKKADAILSGTVHSGGQAISAKVVLYDLEPDTLLVNGDFVLNTFEADSIKIEVTSDGYFPYIGTISILPGQNNINIELSPTTTVFSENWENGMDNWVLEGPWVLQSDLSASGSAITDSWGGNGFYEVNCDVHIRTANPIELPAAGDIYLAFDQHLYSEWEYDWVRVEVSSDQSEWQELWRESGRFDWWHTQYISLNDFAGQSLYFRFRLVDESVHEEMTDPGWTIDNIRIIGGYAVPNQDAINQIPLISALYPNFPNPFNPQTTIKYSLSRHGKVKLSIYNLKGQKVKSLVDNQMSSGAHQVIWNGRDDGGNAVSSGVYYYRLETDNYRRTMKMVLLK